MRTRLHNVPTDDSSTGGPKRIKVLIVDPLELERIGMRSVFERYQDIVVSDEAVGWSEAVPKLARLHPDVIIMDISVSNAELLDEMNDTLTRHPGARVLFFAHAFEEATLAAIVRAGIHGCLLKNISSEELVRAVRIVASGDSIIDRPLAEADVGCWCGDEAVRGLRARRLGEHVLRRSVALEQRREPDRTEAVDGCEHGPGVPLRCVGIKLVRRDLTHPHPDADHLRTPAPRA